jgi:hypothetical protein
MAKKNIIKCSISLIIREMQIKTALIGMAIVKNRRKISAGKDVEKWELSYNVGGNVS